MRGVRAGDEREQATGTRLGRACRRQVMAAAVEKERCSRTHKKAKTSFSNNAPRARAADRSEDTGPGGFGKTRADPGGGGVFALLQ